MNADPAFFWMDRQKINTLPLKELHARRLRGELGPQDLLAAGAACAAAIPENPMYLWQPPSSESSSAAGSRPDHRPLSTLPVSVKDLFDVASAPTTCGSGFFVRTRPEPTEDAGYVKRWRATGAVFTGKTHLNEFAYGITGENRWFGDCWIPGFPDRLTGGSSSGAAATVAAGAACIGLGTDTGGSLRVPAALCGLVSFRQSLGFAEMEGAFPLAQSFDTLGWLQRHLSDVSWVAHAVHPEVAPEPRVSAPRLAWVKGSFLEGMDDAVAEACRDFDSALRMAGAVMDSIEAPGWEDAVSLFVPIQASDAAQNHRVYLPEFRELYDPAILERLALGASVTPEALQELRSRRDRFCADWIAPFFRAHEFLVVPAAPVTRLLRGADHRQTRPRLLRFTAPASLGGLPVLTVPWLRDGVPSGGFQILAPRGADARLWALADWLALHLWR